MGRRIIAGALMIGIALTVGIACSSSKDTDPTPVRQFKITPASGASTASVSATPPSQPTTAGSPGQGTPASQATAATSPVVGTPASQATGTPQSTVTSGGGATISIAASNLLFDKTTLTASAGTVKIEFDNKDGGVPHNINFYDGKDASAKSLGSTAIEVGPTKQELTIDVKPGAYHFQCDVHPTTMTGTLTVS